MNSLKSVPPKDFETADSWEDPVIREVREVRHRLAAQFDNDLARVAQDLMRRQVSHGSRLRTLSSELRGD